MKIVTTSALINKFTDQSPNTFLRRNGENFLLNDYQDLKFELILGFDSGAIEYGYNLGPTLFAKVGDCLNAPEFTCAGGDMLNSQNTLEILSLIDNIDGIRIGSVVKSDNPSHENKEFTVNGFFAKADKDTGQVILSAQLNFCDLVKITDLTIV